MRVAFVGKGGAGKSAIAGTFARLMARNRDNVLAIDSDPMPGLAFSLGLPSDDAPIPDEAVVERQEGEEGPRFRLRPDLTPSDAVRQYAAKGPDGVRFLQFGKLRGHVTTIVRSQVAFRSIVSELPRDEWNMIGDLPGGTRQAFFGWADFAQTVVVVVEPTAKSMLSGRRLARLASAKKPPERLVAVANKVREPDDVFTVALKTGLPVIGAVPWDEAFRDAERQGRAPLDAVPDAPAVLAVSSLLQRLEGVSG